MYNCINKLFKREFMEIIETTDAFKALIQDIKTSTPGYRDPLAFGIARVDLGQLNVEKTLQATYPLINWDENFGSAALFIKAYLNKV